MNNSSSLQSFRPHPPDAAGVLSWVHGITRQDILMRAVKESSVWKATLVLPETPAAPQRLRVIATDAEGNKVQDEIQLRVGGDRPARRRAERDQDNALAAWPEHGLLGTQLGPNRNGRKW